MAEHACCGAAAGGGMHGVYASVGVDPRVCGSTGAGGNWGPARGAEGSQLGAAAATLGGCCVGGAVAKCAPGVVEQSAELLLRLPEAV